MVLALMRRELRTLFAAPLAWVILTLFLLVQGYSFYLLLMMMSQPQAPHGSPLSLFFGGTILYWLFLIFIVTAITMGLVARERQRGTLEVLMTFPVSEAHVVLGKYLAALTFYAFLWAPTLLYVVILRHLSGADAVSMGPVAAGYLGTLVIGAAALAVGLLCSTVARSQMVAAVLTFAALSMILLLGPLQLYLHHPGLSAVLEVINIFDHMEDFSRGVVDSRHLVVHTSVVVFFVVASVKVLEASKWR